jgi:hypothetical protein
LLLREKGKGNRWWLFRRLRIRVAKWYTYFQTKNPNLGKFWRVLLWEMMVYFYVLVYFTDIWYILWLIGIVYGDLVHLFPIVVCRTKKNLETLLQRAVFNRFSRLQETFTPSLSWCLGTFFVCLESRFHQCLKILPRLNDSA